MKKQNSKLAFSLIELSVVIIIIGILVVGISNGSRIIRASRLKTAQNLTTSSPVSSMDEILVWYETTLERSFLPSEAVNTDLTSEGTISVWQDINPQTTTPNNATQSTNENKPRYILEGINNLPVVNFDGGYEHLIFDAVRMSGSNYTIFVVERRRSSKSENYFLSSEFAGTFNDRPHFGYRSNSVVTFATYGYDTDYSVPSYSTPNATLHNFVFNSRIGRNYYRNGVLNGGTCSSSPACTTPLDGYTMARIGLYHTSSAYEGDIGEIIIFNKALNNLERTSIEGYLKTKWGIK